MMAAGNYASRFGVNSEGLRRRGFSAEAILPSSAPGFKGDLPLRQDH